MDRRVRAALAPGLDALAVRLGRLGATPGRLTLAGLLLGLGSALLAGTGRWWPALAVFLLSRLADGLDGPLARASGGGTERGGFLDLVADFLVYGAFVVGVAVALPDVRVAALVLLLAYYVNGTALLALAAAAARAGRTAAPDDGRSIVLVGGLAEGTETIVAHGLMALLGAVAPGLVAWVVWGFAAVVAATVVQRTLHGARVLG